jgi:hypothetical protein
MATDSDDVRVRAIELGWSWRVLLLVGGAILILLSLQLFTRPPTWSQHKLIGTVSEYADQTQSDPTVFCVALLGAGVVMVAVAANGRKLVEISAGGAKFDAPTPEELAEDVGRATAISGLSAAAAPKVVGKPRQVARSVGSPYEVFPPEAIPLSVLADASAAIPNLVLRLQDVEYAFCDPLGSGGREWYVRLVGGEVLLLKYEK